MQVEASSTQGSLAAPRSDVHAARGRDGIGEDDGVAFPAALQAVRSRSEGRPGGDDRSSRGADNATPAKRSTRAIRAFAQPVADSLAPALGGAAPGRVPSIELPAAGSPGASPASSGAERTSSPAQNQNTGTARSPVLPSLRPDATASQDLENGGTDNAKTAQEHRAHDAPPEQNAYADDLPELRAAGASGEAPRPPGGVVVRTAAGSGEGTRSSDAAATAEREALAAQEASGGAAGASPSASSRSSGAGGRSLAAAALVKLRAADLQAGGDRSAQEAAREPGSGQPLGRTAGGAEPQPARRVALDQNGEPQPARRPGLDSTTEPRSPAAAESTARSIASGEDANRVEPDHPGRLSITQGQLDVLPAAGPADERINLTGDRHRAAPSGPAADAPSGKHAATSVVGAPAAAGGGSSGSAADGESGQGRAREGALAQRVLATPGSDAASAQAPVKDIASVKPTIDSPSVLPASEPPPTSTTTAGPLPAPGPGGVHGTFELAAWADRLADTVRLVATARDTEMRFRLTPEELGHIDVRVSIERDGVRAAIMTEHDTTRALLAGQRHLLEAALERSDLRLTGFSVDLGSSGGFGTPADSRAHGGENSLPAGPVPPAALAENVDPVPAQLLVAAGHLSLRV